MIMDPETANSGHERAGNGHGVKSALEGLRSFQQRRNRRRRLRRRRRLPPLSVIPTLCTLGNLVAGFAAIHYAAKDPSQHVTPWDWRPLTMAGAMVFLGMILDAVDGSLARL